MRKIFCWNGNILGNWGLVCQSKWGTGRKKVTWQDNTGIMHYCTLSLSDIWVTRQSAEWEPNILLLKTEKWKLSDRNFIHIFQIQFMTFKNISNHHEGGDKESEHNPDGVAIMIPVEFNLLNMWGSHPAYYSLVIYSVPSTSSSTSPPWRFTGRSTWSSSGTLLSLLEQQN